jgi:hypothetical protein
MAGETVTVLELDPIENPAGGVMYVIVDGVDYQITFDNLTRFVKRVQLSFTSANLVGQTLSVTHNLNQLLPSSICVYDNNNKRVVDANFEYSALTVNTGSLEIYQPITGVWKLVLKY